MENLYEGKDLAEYAVSKIDRELKGIPKKSLYDPISNSLKKTLSITVLTAVVLLLVFMKSLPEAYVRLVQPTKEFSVPLPFVLSNLSGNQSVLGGDTLTINVAGYGDLPDSIHIHWEDREKSSWEAVPQENEVYHHTFSGVKRDTRYWAEYNSLSWFSAWE